MSATDEQVADALIHQLAKRHSVYAAPVQDAPLMGVNVWQDSTDRYPTHTAWVSEGKIEWGPNWEYSRPATQDPAEVADAIVATF
jgi:hypothetical protein